MTNRQRAKLLLLCIVFGAIANLLVAWILFSDKATSAFVTGEPLTDDAAQTVWNRYAMRSEVPAGVEGQVFHKLAVDEFVIFPVVPDAGIDHGGKTDWVVEWHCGWPFKSFRAGADFLPEQRTINSAIHNSMPFQFVGLRIGEYLPYGPMFPGILINTIFYAGIVWMAIRGPAEARRRWRELKGRCGRCATPREGLVCAGCGSDLSRAWGLAGGMPPGEARG